MMKWMTLKYIKDQGYKSNEIPFFEFKDENTVTIYMKLKER